MGDEGVHQSGDSQRFSVFPQIQEEIKSKSPSSQGSRFAPGKIFDSIKMSLFQAKIEGPKLTHLKFNITKALSSGLKPISDSVIKQWERIFKKKEEVDLFWLESDSATPKREEASLYGGETSIEDPSLYSGEQLEENRSLDANPEPKSLYGSILSKKTVIGKEEKRDAFLKKLQGNFNVLAKDAFTGLKVYERHPLQEAQVTLTDHKVENLRKVIQENGGNWIQFARQKGEVIQSETAIDAYVYRFVINPNGKIYMEEGKMVNGKYQKTLAEGNFKTVGKMVLVAKYSFGNLSEVKHKAFSEIKEGSVEDQAEFKLNAEFLAKRKEGTNLFAHVHLSREKVGTDGNILIGDWMGEGTADLFFKKYQDPQVRYQICSDLALGTAEIHEEGYIHADLKPDNMMVSRSKDKFIGKVTDLGLALKLEKGVAKRLNGKHVLAFLPHEFHFGDKRGVYTKETDVFMQGLAYAFMWMGMGIEVWGNKSNNPFKENYKNLSDPIFKLKTDPRTKEAWAKVPDNVKEIITRMLDANPSKRPSMTEVSEQFKTLASS